MTHVDDLQRIISDAVIDQVRKRDDRKHPNASHISRTTEARIFRKQLAGGRIRARLRWKHACRAARYTREFRQCHFGHAGRTEASQPALLPERSHFLIGRELASLSLFKTLKHGCAMLFRHNEQITIIGDDLLKYLGDVGLPIFRQPSHLLDHIFQDLGHGRNIYQLQAENDPFPTPNAS